MNEGQHRPGLFVPIAFMILIEKGHVLPIIGQNAGISDGRMANVASNVATDPLSILHTQFGMDIESFPIADKQPVNQFGILRVLGHDTAQGAQTLVLPYLAQRCVVDEGLGFPFPIRVQSAFGDQHVQMVIDL